MLRYLTSGESHGQSLISIIDGLPSNIELNFDEINLELKKRQCGYGRGGRMKIESDKVNILGGVRGRKTLGGPISIEVKNKDYQNWTEHMAPMDEVDFETRKVNNVRPGHADLVGCLKYDFDDARNVLERSSARETASRVAVGAICKQVLKNFNIEFTSHVVQIGDIKDDNIYDFDFIKNNVNNSEIRCVNPSLEEKIKNKTTNKAAKAEPTKTKGKQPVEKTKQAAVKDKKTVAKSKQSAVKESAKPEKMIAKKTPAVKTEVKKAEPKAVEKATENSVETVAQKTANTVTKSVVVPRCNDSKVFAVLSDAFKKQGAATNTQMTVKQITKARETQSYPQQGIRSCNAIVETNSVKYVTDYSIILNDKGFFVQVENAQPAQRF